MCSEIGGKTDPGPLPFSILHWLLFPFPLRHLPLPAPQSPFQFQLALSDTSNVERKEGRSLHYLYSPPSGLNQCWLRIGIK